jgi:hypothetical protein
MGHCLVKSSRMSATPIARTAMSRVVRTATLRKLLKRSCSLECRPPHPAQRSNLTALILDNRYLLSRRIVIFKVRQQGVIRMLDAKFSVLRYNSSRPGSVGMNDIAPAWAGKVSRQIHIQAPAKFRI